MMSILVAYPPESRGQGSLELGRMMGLSSGDPVVVCCVIPDRWQSVGPGRQVDRDYESHLRDLAADALAHARETLGESGVEMRFEAVTARSASAGLLEAVDRFGARSLVMGSSSHGSWGHVALGSVTDRMLHSSPVPVALAPRGYRSRPTGRVERVTVAVDGTRACHDVLGRAAEVAAEVGARLRIVTFAVRRGATQPPEVGLDAEDRVYAAWRAEAADVVELARAALSDRLEQVPELQVAEGRSWAEALDEPGWDDGDVLVIGSSAHRPLLARVFLGSTATRIIRHSPVPVVVVP
jgi:nucleotide-binding universal stress UspA family protein